MKEQLFNKKQLEELTEGDSEIANEILNIFVETTPEVLLKLQEYLKDEKWEDLNREIHKYHTQLKTISSHSIINTVQEAENITIAKDRIRELPSLIDTITKTSWNIIREIKKEIS